MCAIGFIINYQKSVKIDLDFVKEIFTEMEWRGTDASGFYWERATKKRVIRRMLKAPVKAGRMWETVQDIEASYYNEKLHRKYSMNGNEKLIMLHTRKKTQGTEYNNHNNMPIFSEHYVLVHNGVIHSERDKEYGYMGEVDSEQILSAIEKMGIKEGIQATEGSMAIALRERSGDWLYFYREINPLELLYFRKKKILVGISEESYVPRDDTESIVSSNIFDPSVSAMTIPPHSIYRVNVKEPVIEYVDNIERKKEKINEKL